MNELTPKEFIKDFTKDANGKSLIGVLSILVVLLTSLLVTSAYKNQKQKDDFIESEIAGVLIRLKDIQRGIIHLTVRQHVSGEELSYSLHLRRFFEENNIQTGDSIIKKANSNTIVFFKKDQGTFQKCCEFYYPN